MSTIKKNQISAAPPFCINKYKVSDLQLKPCCSMEQRYLTKKLTKITYQTCLLFPCICIENKTVLITRNYSLIQLHISHSINLIIDWKKWSQTLDIWKTWRSWPSSSSISDKMANYLLPLGQHWKGTNNANVNQYAEKNT